ncbi:MAG TPA: DNA primase [Methylomirabilota bacterium]|jgi:DNA primase|nr:DNA primase [Methylomirabilota bacterium]
MASYSTAVLDDIRAGVDIVDLVGRFVNLRKAGVNWKGLCPFHAEKTPSFMVNPKKGIFHCFGCGVGGDVFGFLMRQDRLSFPEAVRALARTAGVTLPDERGAAEAGDSGREELLRAMELAARFYAESLWGPGGERARAYLTDRGIDLDVARRFQLGYAPEGWESLLTFMKSERVAEDTLVAAGLAVAREHRAGVYDRFRGRLLFAIRDLQGRVVAFGGRAFGDEQPKYLNSPETALYTKGNLLFAADLARESIRTKNRALIVEGYVDCLMAHQHGFTETVAALGTAFTPAQLATLRRYCDEVVTFFDADAAGQKAAERAQELLEPTGHGFAWAVNRSGAFETAGVLRVKVALLPAGHDPDTFLRAAGAAAFAERIASARSLLSYALARTIGDSDTTSPRGRTTAFARVALMLSKVADAEEATALSREAAIRLGVDATQLWIEAQRLANSLRKPAAPVGAASASGPAPSAEDRRLIRLLLLSPPARTTLLPLLEPVDVAHPALREVIEALKRWPALEATALLSTGASEAARHMIAALVVEDGSAEDAASSIEQFQRRLEYLNRRRRVRELSRSIAVAQARDGASTLDGELYAVQRDSARVYELTGGSAQAVDRVVDHSHPTGPEGPQGVQAHE